MSNIFKKILHYTSKCLAVFNHTVSQRFHLTIEKKVSTFSLSDCEVSYIWLRIDRWLINCKLFSQEFEIFAEKCHLSEATKWASKEKHICKLREFLCIKFYLIFCFNKNSVNSTNSSLSFVLESQQYRFHEIFWKWL